MAVVTGPLHSSEARGSVGALQYNTWHGRATVRTRSGPVKETQYTDARVALRLLTSNATSTWQGMSDAERALWTTYANAHLDPDWTGSPQRITGYNMFVRINVRIQIMGNPIVETPPSVTLTVMINDLYIKTFDTEVYLAWVASGDWRPAYTRAEIWLTNNHSPGANPTRKQAHRYADCLYGMQEYELTLSAGLWYTAFVRPILTEGVAGPWSRLKFQYPVL